MSASPEEQLGQPEFNQQFAETHEAADYLRSFTSIYDQHQEVLFWETLARFQQEAIGVTPPEHGWIMEQASHLFAAKAAFEMRRGNELQAVALTGEVREFNDEIELWKIATKLGSAGVLQRLGDLKEYAEHSQDKRNLLTYQIAAISLGVDVFTNFYNAKTLLGDKSIVPADETARLERELYRTMFERAVGEIRQGDYRFAESGTLNKYGYSQALERVIVLEQAHWKPYDFSRLSRRKAQARWQEIAKQAHAIAEGLPAPYSELKPEQLTGVVELMTMALRGSEVAKQHLQEHVDQISLACQGGSGPLLDYLKLLFPDEVHFGEVVMAQRASRLDSEPLRDVKRFIELGQLEEAEALYAEFVGYASNEEHYLLAKLDNTTMMQMAGELALAVDSLDPPRPDPADLCSAELELLVMTHIERQKIVPADDVVEQSRFRTDYNRQIDALLAKVDALPFPAQRFQLRASILAFQKQHDTSADSSYRDQIKTIKTIAQGCLTNPISLLTLTKEQIVETGRNLGIELNLPA